jgi:hypothetical protein
MAFAGAGEPDLANWALLSSTTDSLPGSVTQRSPVRSKETSAGFDKKGFGVTVTRGAGDPDLASWALANSTTVSPVVVGRPQVPGGVKGGPAWPVQAGREMVTRGAGNPTWPAVLWPTRTRWGPCCLPTGRRSGRMQGCMGWSVADGHLGNLGSLTWPTALS